MLHSWSLCFTSTKGLCRRNLVIPVLQGSCNSVLFRHLLLQADFSLRCNFSKCGQNVVVQQNIVALQVIGLQNNVLNTPNLTHSYSKFCCYAAHHRLNCKGLGSVTKRLPSSQKVLCFSMHRMEQMSSAVKFSPCWQQHSQRSVKGCGQSWKSSVSGQSRGVVWKWSVVMWYFSRMWSWWL